MQIAAKVFATLLGILVLSRVYTDWKSKKESVVMTVFWTITWAGILLISFYPDLVRRIINIFGGERTGLGTVFGMGLVFILYISYRVYTKANRVEKAINKLCRKIATGNPRQGNKNGLTKKK